MNPSSSRQGRRKIFLLIVLGCLILAVGYTARGILQARAKAGQQTPLNISAPGELEAIQNGPHLVFLRQEEAPYGHVNVVGLDPASSQGSAQTSLRCDRIHYAAGNGLCLMYYTSD